jgi:hypothetical protein
MGGRRPAGDVEVEAVGEGVHGRVVVEVRLGIAVLHPRLLAKPPRSTQTAAATPQTTHP